MNESGKTNLLLPLWKFNPADNSTKIDLLLDFPRNEYSKIDENDGERKAEPFIEVLFEITDEELADFNTKYDEFLKPEESDEGEETPKKELPEKVELSKFLLIKKDMRVIFISMSLTKNAKKKPKTSKSLLEISYLMKFANVFQNLFTTLNTATWILICTSRELKRTWLV